MADARRMIELGMVPPLAKEVATQIDNGGEAGAVNSVNGQTGTVVLDAEDVSALPDTYVPAWDDVTGKPSTFPATTPVATATALATTRAFSLTGDVTASAVNFNGTAAVALTTAIAAGVIVNADISASAAIALTKLANTASITTDGGTTIGAGTVQATIEAVADLVDPARVTVTATGNIANTTPGGTKHYSTAATGVTLTLVAGAAVGKSLHFFQVGAGAITLAAGSGETLLVESGFDPVSRAAGSAISAEKISSTVWLVYGALASA